MYKKKNFTNIPEVYKISKDKVVRNYLNDSYEFIGEFSLGKGTDSSFNGQIYHYDEVQYTNKDKYNNKFVVHPPFWLEHVVVKEKKYNKFLLEADILMLTEEPRLQTDSKCTPEYEIFKNMYVFYQKVTGEKLGDYKLPGPEDFAQNKKPVCKVSMWVTCNSQIKVTQILKYAAISFESIMTSNTESMLDSVKKPVLKLQKFEIEKESIFVSMI